MIDSKIVDRVRLWLLHQGYHKPRHFIYWPYLGLKIETGFILFKYPQSKLICSDTYTYLAYKLGERFNYITNHNS